MVARLDVVDLPRGVDEVEFLHPERHRVVDLRLVLDPHDGEERPILQRLDDVPRLFQRKCGTILDLDHCALDVRCIAELLRIQGFPVENLLAEDLGEPSFVTPVHIKRRIGGLPLARDLPLFLLLFLFLIRHLTYPFFFP